MNKSLIVLFGLMGLMLGVFLISAFSSEDVDDVCSIDNKILVRINGVWDCYDIVFGGVGIDGEDGIDGINGTNGIDGEDGEDGIDGINGTNINASYQSTKEFFVYPTAENSPTDLVGYFSSTGMVSGESVYFNFHVPNDFNSLVEAVIVIIPDSTETIQYDLISEWGSVGEYYYTSLSDFSESNRLNVTEEILTEINVTGLLISELQWGSSIDVGDYVGVRLISRTTQIRPFMLRFKYE